MNQQQPEALRLANELESYIGRPVCTEAAAELRRLHQCLRNVYEVFTPMMEFKRSGWVGLTGDEIEDLPKGGTWGEAIRAAEAILREKNGG